MKWAIALWAVTAFLAGCRAFEVPEPLIEVFHPKGLRVSIPDSDGVQSVQFLLSLSPKNGDVFELSDDTEKSEDGRWTYWNPEVVLNEKDEIYYKVTVEQDDMYWPREGDHTVERVFSADGGLVERGETLGGYSGLGGIRNLDLFRHRNRGLITEGKKSSYHSSYSSYQNSDSKPITRSSTSSTSGTFLVKPDGEMEASGYKKSSKYDSTKREGEQWEFSESELSPEELEELKRFVGPNFRSFSELTAGQVEEFKRLHGSNFHIPERIRATLPESNAQSGSSSYEESYFSKESSSSMRTQPRNEYARHPHNFQHYHDRTASHESSSGRLKPAYQSAPIPDPAHPLPASANHYEEHRYNHEASSSASHPIALSVVDNQEYQKEIPPSLPSGSRRSNSRNYEFSRGESHRVVSNQTPPRSPVRTNPSPSYGTASETTTNHHLASASQHRESFDEYAEDDVQLVEKPKYQSQSYYRGHVFRSLTTSRANSPQECSVWSETNYDHVTDLREIQKSISKIGCLASLSEHSLKEELRTVQQQNTELSRRLEALDRDFRKYQSSCSCSG